MIGSTITIIEETGSTNADLVRAAREGEAREGEAFEGEARVGDWLVALRQTAGRGRQGREWFDGAGNFMGSTLVERRAGDPPPASLSFVTALAVAEAIGTIIGDAAPVRLKWPNDVLVAEGKASGILLEMVDSSRIVVGIGINLARAPELPDRKTASLAEFAPPVTPRAFADILAVAFGKWLEKWREAGLPIILRDFLKGSGYCHGTALCVHDSDGSRISGTFLGLDETDGALRLLLADGSQRVIRAGDIL